MREPSLTRLSVVVCALSFLFSPMTTLTAGDITAVITNDSSKLVIDCENVTTDEAKEKGGAVGEFIREEELGCEKSLSIIKIPTKTEEGIVSAGAYLFGTIGMDHFGINSSTRYSAKDIVVTRNPKVISVKSKTGVGAELQIVQTKTRYSTMKTETAGTYTFGVYGYVVEIVPIKGGVGYEDIESVELDWNGVSVSGSYGIKDPKTEEVTWNPFSFDATGTSVIDGDDLNFTTRTNTASNHCATLAKDYTCTYAEGYKPILDLANVTNKDGTVSCSGVKDFVKKNPDKEDVFVCKEGNKVIDCKDIQEAQLICKDKSGKTIDCSEVKDKNACYKSGKTADDYGYQCFYGTKQVSCNDAGFGSGCPTICKLNGTEVPCDEVLDLNACEEYNIFPDKMGYTCELNGEPVSCSSFGKGICSEKAKCNYGEDPILCSRYENALACGKKYSFNPSTKYWCQVGNVQVSCSDMTPARKCDLTPLVCRKSDTGEHVDCSKVADLNACRPYGYDASSSAEYVCTFDDVEVPCTIVEPTTGSVCPLLKECAVIQEGNKIATNCRNMDNAIQCGKEGWGDFSGYYACTKGLSPFECSKETNPGTCDLTLCAKSCDYLGVSLDGTENTCVCLPAPICSGPIEEQDGTNVCKYGGTAQGGGTRACVCNPEPDCTVECPNGGTPKGNGETGCSCNVKCEEICTYGVKGESIVSDPSLCECYEPPICEGDPKKQTGDPKCPYGGYPAQDGAMSCTEATCPYGYLTDANPNKCDRSICPYGSK